MKLDNLPFHIGSSDAAINPEGLPDKWPFYLHFDQLRGAITQQVTPELLGILDQAYRAGQLIGTPLAEDSYGKPYADDFLHFIEQLGLPHGANAIEIGAGVGYLTRRLKDEGLRIIGIEPGRGYAGHWEKNGVEIVNDFFPTSHVTGRFDLICSYAVLEHIIDPAKFLKDVRDHLAPDGVAVFSVPDCAEEIAVGDPSILLHEHISYFDAGSLARLIQSAGMNAVVTKSGFGRCLYAIASFSERHIGVVKSERELDLQVIKSYPDRCIRFIERVRRKLSRMAAKGTLGIYCAARGLALLDSEWDMRFFDDDPAQQGKFLPPFKAVIKGRDDLFLDPVSDLVILSRTFGHRIRHSLREQGYRGRVVILEEI